MMCTTSISTLTLTAMLHDPLIKMVMRSDNVSEEDHSELLFRVKRLPWLRARRGQKCRLTLPVKSENRSQQAA